MNSNTPIYTSDWTLRDTKTNFTIVVKNIIVTEQHEDLLKTNTLYLSRVLRKFSKTQKKYLIPVKVNLLKLIGYTNNTL